MLTDPLGRLRAIGLSEAVSFLLLLGVAMPLKYWAGLPLAVRVVGSLHGLLFVAFLFALFRVTVERAWPFKRWLSALISSIVPFGTFVFDRSLKREIESGG